MKRILLTTLALLLGASTWASAASSVWKAEKDGAVIYLGGTCHILRESDYPLPPEFERAYKAADSVVFETDIGKLNEPATQGKLLAKAVYADGSTLDQHLSARTFAALRSYCVANDVPLQQFSRLKPSVLMVTLALMEFMKLGVSQQGVDQFFHGLATREGKTVAGLETVDEQIDHIVSLADGAEDEFVAYSLKDMQTIREQFAVIADAWRRGDTGRLEELLVVELKTLQPRLYKRLIADRNNNWLPVIDNSKKPLRTRFILVGIAHLVGPDGIIAALHKRGYRVEKL